MPLHPQSQSFLDAVAEQGAPGWHEMPPAEGREKFKGLMDLFGDGPELSRVEELKTDCGITIRLYSSCDTAEALLPVIVYFHGGGWVLGNIDTHDALCRQLALQSGFIVASVDYGLAPENKFPGPLNDCYAATKHIHENARQLGIDANQIAVAGDSAGGNLAAAVSLKARDDQQGPPIKFQVLIYPVVEPNFESDTYREFESGFGLSLAEMKWFWDQHLVEESQSGDPLVSVTNAESLNDLPATHLVVAEYDVLRAEGQRFAEMLSVAGVKTTTKQYDGMLHGFVHLQGVFDDAATAIQDIANAIRNHLTQETGKQ